MSGGLIAAVAAPADSAQAVGTVAPAPVAKAAEPAAVALSTIVPASLGGAGSLASGRVQMPNFVPANDVQRPQVKESPRAGERVSRSASRPAVASGASVRETPRPTTAPRAAAESNTRRAASTTDDNRRSSSARTETRAASTRTETPRASRSSDTPTRRTSTATSRRVADQGATSKATAPKKKATADAPSSASSSSVVSIAKRYIGTPYVYGGSTPNGFDCSGFTGYVFNQVGIDLPRTARAQQAAATRVSDPRPGDLVFYNFPATHVMIYVGNGMVIDAPSPGKTVQVHKMWGKNVSYGRVG